MQHAQLDRIRPGRQCQQIRQVPVRAISELQLSASGTVVHGHRGLLRKAVSADNNLHGLFGIDTAATD